MKSEIRILKDWLKSEDNSIKTLKKIKLLCLDIYESRCDDETHDVSKSVYRTMNEAITKFSPTQARTAVQFLVNKMENLQ